MAFEEYIPRRVSSKQPAVTIGKKGLLMFNVSCVLEYLKDNKFVKLYYDADTKRIGMKLFKEQEEYTELVVLQELFTTTIFILQSMVMKK